MKQQPPALVPDTELNTLQLSEDFRLLSLPGEKMQVGLDFISVSNETVKQRKEGLEEGRVRANEVTA